MNLKYPPPPIDPGHDARRAVISKTGLGLLAVGIPCGLTGLVLFGSNFFGDIRDMSMGRGFVGMILMAAGMVASMFGLQALFVSNAGRIARYQMGEVMPVAKDMVPHAAPMVTEMARAFSAGFSDPEATIAGPTVAHACGTINGPDDRFCKGCGAALAPRLCPECHARNDADAKFCANCGGAIQGA